MMQRSHYRNIQNFLLFMTIFILVFSFYIEYVHQISPCPLCMMQRVCAFLLGVFCMVGFGITALRRAKMITIIQSLLAVLGLYFSGRQLWLQSLPFDQSAQCLPGVDVLIHYFSWDLILKSFVWGTGDCSRVDWRWMGLSIPVWSAMYFILMFAVNSYVYRSVCRSLKKGSKLG